MGVRRYRPISAARFETYTGRTMTCVVSMTLPRCCLLCYLRYRRTPFQSKLAAQLGEVGVELHSQTCRHVHVDGREGSIRHSRFSRWSNVATSTDSIHGEDVPFPAHHLASTRMEIVAKVTRPLFHKNSFVHVATSYSTLN